MNHRREEHPSKKRCRYFLKQQCFFKANKCWYRHEENDEEEKNELSAEMNCRYCAECFSSKNDLMMHKKQEHIEKVERCRKFLQGNCSLSENSCWYKHENNVTNQETNENVEIEESQQSQLGFCEAKERAPPDQLKIIMEMITKLSVQMTEIGKAR